MIQLSIDFDAPARPQAQETGNLHVRRAIDQGLWDNPLALQETLANLKKRILFAQAHGDSLSDPAFNVPELARAIREIASRIKLLQH